MSDSIFSEKTSEMIRQYRGPESLAGRMAVPHGILEELALDFAKYTDEYLLGDVMSRAGLSMRERSLIAIAVLAVNRYEFVAPGHMRWALNIGITREEVLEVILLIVPYGDWPIGKELIDLLESAYPGYVTTLPDNPAEGFQAMSRLSLRERTLVQIGALAARRFGQRLKHTMGFALNLGIAPGDILEVLMQVTPFAGWPVGVEAIRVAKDVLPGITAGKDGNGEPSESQNQGRRIIGQLIGAAEADETFQLLQTAFPDFMTVVTEEHLFGRIWSRPLLSLRERCMITIALLVVFRFNQDLKSHMRFALNTGLTQEEILEIIMHAANYTCWGSGVGACYCAKEVFAPGGPGQGPKFDAGLLRARGKDVIRQLNGGRQRDELLSQIEHISPDFVKVLTEAHLFGEVWSRSALGLRERCMMTLAIMIARGFNEELRAHMKYAFNIGMTRDEILEIVLHTANYTCWGAGVGAILKCKDILIAH